MELDKLEKQLEFLSKKNKKQFEKIRENNSKPKRHDELDPNSMNNKKREVFKKICLISYDLSSFEFFNKLIDHAMEMKPEQLKKLLE